MEEQAEDSENKEAVVLKMQVIVNREVVPNGVSHAVCHEISEREGTCS